MLYVGIDPGASGAIVALTDQCDKWHTDLRCIQKLDATESDIRDAISDFVLDGLCCAFIERVAAMPKQGVSSTFKFGQSYGFLRGMLIAHRIPFEEVTPRRWQAAMGCLSGGDKNVTKARAQQLFPQQKVTHAIADALLIAEYCRRVKSGELERATA